MKKVLLTTLTAAILTLSGVTANAQTIEQSVIPPQADTKCQWIQGYYRKDGTWVSGHYRGC